MLRISSTCSLARSESTCTVGEDEDVVDVKAEMKVGLNPKNYEVGSYSACARLARVEIGPR